MKKIAVKFVFFLSIWVNAQHSYWQQHIDYKMNVNVDAQNYKYVAKQIATYSNNSPDVLEMVFYHLYLNAFQPESEMDYRLQTISDPDRRMVTNIGTKNAPIFRSKIADLKENQQGYIRIKSLKQNGKKVDFEVIGTILKVKLHTKIPSKGKAVFEMEYEAQIPEMIRRTGRNSADGVALSMAQWYPKMAEYDVNGWHTSQYIAREFYGVWANFDVSITIDKNYIVASTGVLQDEKISENKKTWRYVAKKVHDFTWAADPDFQRDVHKVSKGKTIEFFYKKYNENWKKIQPELLKVFQFFNEKIGEYPWEKYAFIQGGDGGMEYAMCTLIAGGNNYEALLETAIHEMGHAWFQHIFASDELAYSWMDEGFTTYIEEWAISEIVYNAKNINAWSGSYKGYFSLIDNNLQNVPTTHADRYDRNSAYSNTSYSKGSVFLAQLGYIIGRQNLEKVFKEFYRNFAMKHTNPTDFIRTAEKVSKMQLGWYLNEFMQTTHIIDYGIKSVESVGEKSKILLERIGRMPMPINLQVTLKNGQIKKYYIPSLLTLGERPLQPFEEKRKGWAWANPQYTFEISIPKEEISKIEIDAEKYMADVLPDNNIYFP